MNEDIVLEWDEGNAGHLNYGFTVELCEQVASNFPVVILDFRKGTSGSHFFIAPDDNGRMWTIAVLQKGGNLWRPITGWPSTNRQIRLYREESND